MSFVSANVAFVRRTLGLSQAQLSDQLGIKRSLLGAYEEARATPRYDVLERLSQLSGHSVPDLLNKRLVPEGYQAPSKRGRPAGSARNPVERTEAPVYSAPAPVSVNPEPAVPYPATLTLTVDTAGQPLVSLIAHGQLNRYGTQSANASYVAALPTLTLPMLEEGQAYRAFEVAPGQIHVCKLVRNWAGIRVDAGSHYVLAYRNRVLLAVPYAAGKGLEWHAADGALTASAQRVEEPLEIWQSEWVLTRKWQPLPAQLDAILDRLSSLEAKLG